MAEKANEIRRQAALREYAILDTPPEPPFDGLVRVAAHVCHAPMALISFLDQDRQWFKARVGLSVTQTCRANAFCAFTVQTDRGMIVPDACADERFASNPLVTGPPFIRFYAGVPLMTPAGVALGTLCVLDTEVRNLTNEEMEDLRVLASHVVDELELRRSRAEAQAANRTKSLFVASVSHEIRTPLTAILGYSELIRRDATSPCGPIADDRESWIDIIHDNATRLLGMVDALLDVPRVETGDLALSPGSVYIRHLIGEAYVGVRAKALEKRLKLDLHVAPDVPDLLVTDAMRLRQAIGCLMDNAVKFTDAGRVSLAASMELSEQGMTMLRIDVSDTGPGLSELEAERVFDCFEQAAAAEDRANAGVGLGLYISRGICQQMSGTLDVTETSPSGSTFTIRVPAVTPPVTPAMPAPAAAESTAIELLQDVEPAPDQAPEPTAPVAAPQDPAARRVLVVDDVPANRRLLSEILRRAGVSVDLAVDGKEAVDRLASERYDAVLMDMQMPVMDGYTATRTLRQRQDTTPVIAVTAHATNEDETRCMAAGCDAFLTKPVRIDDVVKLIDRLMVKRNAA